MYSQALLFIKVGFSALVKTCLWLVFYNIGEGLKEGRDGVSIIKCEGYFVVFKFIGVSDKLTKADLACHEYV